MKQPLYASPKILDDNRVAFHVFAPEATKVQIEFGKPEGPERGEKVYDLERNEKGDWTVTTDPALPGFHYYNVLVDGFKAADPAAACYFGWGFWCSGVEIPEPEFSAHLPNSVPHGEVRLHWYDSPLTNTTRRCLVYTPPGYEEDPTKRYPVLHLQHGSGEAEWSWTGQGKANFILDNLIAEGKARPMLVVMDSGYAQQPGTNADQRDKNLFGDVVIKELVPEIDRCFRTEGSRGGRALAGLSMGAGQALRIGLANLDVFGSVAALSGGGRNFDPKTSYDGIFANPSAANDKLDLLWMGCGRQDGGFAGARGMHEALEKAGVTHEWYELEGSHDWGVWRRHLYDLAQKLFVARG